MITKQTMVGVSVGSLAALLASMWLVVSEVQSWVGQISDNTQALAELSRDVKLSRVYDMIGDLRSERRDLRRILEARPNDRVVLDQIEEIDDEIQLLEKILDCLLTGGKDCVVSG